MKLQASVLLMLAPLAGLSVGCGADAPTDPSPTASTGGALHESVVERIGAVTNDPSTCSFSRGVTTCVTTTQREEQSTHSEVSGCVFGPTFPPVPGRRTRTFADVLLVTETTETFQHGRHGRVFATQTATQTQILSSTLISDTCEPI